MKINSRILCLLSLIFAAMQHHVQQAVRQVILAVAVVTMTCCSSSPLAATVPLASTAQTVNNFIIKRGTNISHWLSQSAERGEARL